MALTFADVKPAQMELTPMQVYFQGPDDMAPIDLGGTLGNCVIGMAYKKADIKADQFGSTVLDQRVSGIEIKMTTEFAETKTKELWKVLFPFSTLVVDTGQKAIDFLSAIGDSGSIHAGVLNLHPLSIDPATLDFDFTFWKAYASAESEITYGPDNQARLKIVWMILPDTSVSPARFMRYGDATIG